MWCFMHNPDRLVSIRKLISSVDKVVNRNPLQNTVVQSLNVGNNGTERRRSMVSVVGREVVFNSGVYNGKPAILFDRWRIRINPFSKNPKDYRFDVNITDRSGNRMDSYIALAHDTSVTVYKKVGGSRTARSQRIQFLRKLSSNNARKVAEIALKATDLHLADMIADK
jgi:hypothetical protein